jgi:hypothetical protein
MKKMKLNNPNLNNSRYAIIFSPEPMDWLDEKVDRRGP